MTNQCPKLTDNHYVQFAIVHWQLILIAIMALWIVRRGIK